MGKLIPVKVEDVEGAVRAILSDMGHAPEHVDVITEVVMYAELRGNSQGLAKFTGSGLPMLAPSPQATPIRVLRETPSSLLLDGGRQPGMVVMADMLRRGAAKIRESGTGIVAVGSNNTFTSTGAIGFFCDRAARQHRLIAIAFAGSFPVVAAHGAAERFFGTNPIAAAFPTARGESLSTLGDPSMAGDGDPVVLDLATSAAAFFEVVAAQKAGRPLRKGVAIDENGEPTDSPDRVISGGALRAFDGSPKGAALSLLVEVLTGPLVGASFGGVGQDWGNLLILIDPAAFVEARAFLAHMAILVKRIKGLKKAPGVDEIVVPGERGNAAARRALSQGVVHVDETLWSHVTAAAAAAARARL